MKYIQIKDTWYVAFSSLEKRILKPMIQPLLQKIEIDIKWNGEDDARLAIKNFLFELYSHINQENK